MKLVDHIRHKRNPEIRKSFERISRDYEVGLKTFGIIYQIDTSFSTPFRVMQKICFAEEEIKRLQNEIEENNSNWEKRYEVSVLSELFPHGFVVLCHKYLGGILENKNILMPGMRKSLREERINKEKSNLIIQENPFLVYGGQYKRLGTNSKGGLATVSLPIDGYTFVPSTTKDLLPTHISILYTHLDEFHTEDKIIKDKLEEEDINIAFDDEILDNPDRAALYPQYIRRRNISRIDNYSEKSYIVNNLQLLDGYIARIKERADKELKKLIDDYPDGVAYYRKHHSPAKDWYIMSDPRLIMKYDRDVKNGTKSLD